MATPVKVICCLLLAVSGWSVVIAEHWNSPRENTYNDESWSWKKALVDLGIYERWAIFNNAVKQSVRKAETYSDEDLTRDWRLFTSNPGITTFWYFLRNAFFPLIVRTVSQINILWNKLYVSVMQFTKKKCDAFLGKEAPLHPWNVMKLEKETVSMLVLMYGAALSLILIKLCSFWNFLAWLAVGYLAYVIGGPYFLFQWLVFITGFFWYTFDMILTYPYYCAATFLMAYICSHYYKSDERNATIVLPREFRTLSAAVDELERKTDSIERKIDRLAELIEK